MSSRRWLSTRDRRRMIALYLVGNSVRTIAAASGFAADTVQRTLRRAGVPRREA